MPEEAFDALKEHGARTRHFAVTGVLYLHADHQGIAFPSETTVGKAIGCSERTVRRVMSDLVNWGFMTVARSEGEANTYCLRHIYAPTPVTSVRGQGSRPRTLVTTTPDTSVPGPRTPVTAEQSLNSVEQSPGPRAAEERGPGEEPTAVDPRDHSDDPRLQAAFSRFLDHATMEGQ